MIKVSEEVFLQSITIESYDELYALMQRIYPPAYVDYWKDDGSWYIENQYNFDKVKQELDEVNSDYYFIYHKKKLIGILRLVYNINTEYIEEEGFVKLHRIYLDQTIQNQGIGKKLMDWIIKTSIKKGYKKLWLEVMEKQPQALHFYKKYNFTQVDKVQIPFELVFKEYRGMFKMLKTLT